MVGLARAALCGMVPAELLLFVLLVSGFALPAPVIAAAEVLLLAVSIVELVAAYRLFRAARMDGADVRMAARHVYARLVPEQVRRIMGFDVKGMVSLVLWGARRQHGVPPGATALSYSKAQTPTMLLFLFAMVAELVAAEVVLRAIGAPVGLRMVVLLIDGYSILIVLAIMAACVTRPHVVSAAEVRVRYGAFFDLRIPRDLIVSVRRVRNMNESGMISMDGEELAIVVSAQTNLVIELAEPVTAVRPLGRRALARSIRLFADDPGTAVAALRPRPDLAVGQ